MGIVGASHHGFLLLLRRIGISYARRLSYRRDVAHFLRQGQPLRAGADDNLRADIRLYIIWIRILRRDDDLRWNDRSDGGRSACVVAEKPI